ncbi:Na+/H+ antiporter subunit E [Cereibacter sp. SYSU M97828]|nr:Na+/H+ antiporter subunit E [Cereibacter flavus]
MKRILPHPFLALLLLIVWLVLTRFTPGQFILGAAVALVASRAMSALEPTPITLRKVHRIPVLLGVLVVDIARSNFDVARLILNGGRHGKRRSGMIEIELETRNRTALALLAIIVTATPGTAWLGWNPRRGVLLLHVFDLVEEADWKDLIKNRYEKALREILE